MMNEIFSKIRSVFPVTDRILEICNKGTRTDTDLKRFLVYIDAPRVSIHERTNNGLKFVCCIN